MVFDTCCNLGTLGFDCAIIPNPVKNTANDMALTAARSGLCGGEFGSIAAMVDAGTVCCE